tara:strand:- start:191 stop:529 length:339 start_codon:yes stop_codon:yes gene_type:complete
MDDKEKWEALYNLSEIPKWGYIETSWGKKILAKKFEIFGGEVHDFTIYKLERMIDASWERQEGAPDAYILAEILEAYLSEDVYIEWVEGFPMAMPNVSDSEFLEELEFDPSS